jgi:DNA modification methylase
MPISNMPNFNDLNLEDWKNTEIWTDSLWIIPERDKSGKHDGFYHGNFVPQIPRQLILRYTKKDDVVFDPFSGSGTTAYEAESLGRHFVGVDIQPEIVEHVKRKIDNKNYFAELIVGDSTDKNTFSCVIEVLNKKKRKNVQLAILHPPYSDIIKFSNHEKDLSNAKSLEDFLNNFSLVISNSLDLLEKNRYLAIVIGDKYTQGKWIPLGFYCLNEAQKLGLTLKSIIIKNIEGNRANYAN